MLTALLLVLKMTKCLQGKLTTQRQHPEQTLTARKDRQIAFDMFSAFLSYPQHPSGHSLFKGHRRHVRPFSRLFSLLFPPLSTVASPLAHPRMSVSNVTVPLHSSVSLSLLLSVFTLIYLALCFFDSQSLARFLLLFLFFSFLIPFRGLHYRD